MLKDPNSMWVDFSSLFISWPFKSAYEEFYLLRFLYNSVI